MMDTRSRSDPYSISEELISFLFSVVFQRESQRDKKASSTLRASQAVPHPSTDRALRRLTSEVGRDPVHSTRYGRQRTYCIPNAASLGGPSYQASVPWSLDAVMCCVAVCYHKYMEHVALAPSCALDYAHPSQQARMAGLFIQMRTSNSPAQSCVQCHASSLGPSF